LAEKPMPRTILRCHSCGLRVELALSDVDSRGLRAQGYLTRYCRECRGNTRWTIYEPVSSVRLADADPEVQLRARVLIIDDDEDVLVILGKALSRERFDLTMAPSAREALTRLARADYDVILSDIRMPDFDGTQLFRFLDEHLPEYKDRVIFLTGDIANPETLKFLKQSNRPYLTKPIDIPALLEALRPYQKL
jgi:CheY-like chemotaxis protein